jgi:hypothetical protein
MRTHVVALLLVGLVFSGNFVLPDSVRGEPAVEIKPIGKIVIASGSFTIEHVDAVVVQASAAGSDQAKVGDFVYKGDVVQTGSDGKIGMVFTDGTAFNLLSNARIVLNEYVFDPNSKSNATFFSLTKGTFTFVAGKIAKTGDMKIDTPLATMGIRGTTPHVQIGTDGAITFSTLIEENKKDLDKVDTGNKKPAKQRQAKNSPSEAEIAAQRRADAELDRMLDIRIIICRC